MVVSIYCIICGKKIIKHFGGDFCSENCKDKFYIFKNNEYQFSISGFCTVCGYPHYLEKESLYRNIAHRHKECYSIRSMSFFEKQMNEKKKRRDEKEDKRRIEEEDKRRIEEEDKRRIEEEDKRRIEEEDKRRIEEEKRLSLLSAGMLYDEETNLLVCPKCKMYSVEYAHYVNDWFCTNCNNKVKINKSIDNFKLNVTPKHKYHIYKHYGIGPLAKLTGDSFSGVQKFIASYFEQCCTSMGDNCVYYTYFEDLEISKQINYINNIFDNSICECKKLYDDILKFATQLNTPPPIPKKYRKLLETTYSNDIKLLYQDYLLIKEAIETIMKELESSIIATASVSLNIGQKVYIQNTGDELIAVINNDDLISSIENDNEAYCWNDAKKSELVGVCPVSPDAMDAVVKMFEESKNKYEEISDLVFIKKLDKLLLPPLEKKIVFLILENNGYFQNRLWKSLNIDSRKCSRKVKSLVDKEIILRQPAVNNGSRTYKLYIRI